MLRFESGSPSVIDAFSIEYVQPESGLIDGMKIVQIQDDERLFLEGEFGGFRLYCLVTHPRPEVIAGSVKRISDQHFGATLRLELQPGKLSEHDVLFRSPLLPLPEVTHGTRGLYPDSLVFSLPGRTGKEAFVCDLTFLTHYADNSPLIPLKVLYVGIAKAQNRTAEDRLGEGHEKLQKLLAEHVRKPSRQTVSIVLYRPSPLVPPVLQFPDVLETIEASMIRYFRPSKYNVRRLNFPHDSPDLTSKLYAIGTHRILNIVEAPKGTSLWSEYVDPETKHAIMINLDRGAT